MASKTSPSPPSAIHPPIGTLIDGDSLELVEVLGVGGYGVVYRAVDVRYPSKSYAVKCLVAAGHQTARQRQIHIREITLHQLASIHPGVVTLHRVVEHFNHTYIIMDYAPDHDLFTQILHNCRYLGNDALIKDVFLQMLDAVDYCHSLGIYHRDLKPENILCFDDGLRVAITDFGLATTDKISDEFRTGSVYHMSPECQGGAFAPGGKYSPMFNDIWSLGIILLNLATGRNPWKSATADDPTFQAYLRDPYGFLPTVLPISNELNDILVQMLDIDWRQRMKINDIRYAIEELTSFYSVGVVFEGSMARCPWEAGMDIDSSESSEEPVEEATPSPPVSVAAPSPVKEELTSSWSKDSNSDIIFAGRSPIENEENYGVPWPEYSSCAATWAFDSPASSSSSNDVPYSSRDRCETPSDASTESPTPSLPATPNHFDMTFATQQPKIAGLTINTDLSNPRIFVNGANEGIDRTFSVESDMMHTAIEYDPYSSLFFLSTPVSAKLVPDSAVTAVAEDKEMISPSVWRRSYIQMASPDECSPRETENHFARSASPSPEEPHWTSWLSAPQHPFAQVQSQPHHPSQPTSTSAFAQMTDSSSPRQQAQRQSRVFTPRKPLRKSLIPGSPVPPSPVAAHAGHSPLTPRYPTAHVAHTPIATSPPAPKHQHQQPRAQAYAQEQQQGRFTFFPRSTPPPTPQQAAAQAAASAQVGAAARGRAVHAKPYSTFGRRKAIAQQVGQGHQGVQDQDLVESSSAGGRSSKTSSRCSSRSGRESVCSSAGSSGTVERVTERRRVVGRRSATRHWFNPGKFFAAVGAA